MRNGPAGLGGAMRPGSLSVQRGAASLEPRSTEARCAQAKVAVCGGSDPLARREATLQNTGSRRQAENAPRLRGLDSNCSNGAANANV